MFPGVGVWKQHRDSIAGVSDDERGETFWKVENGARLFNMPAWQNSLVKARNWRSF